MKPEAQIILLLNPIEASQIEKVWAEYTPEQCKQIKAHGTLIRCEEVEDFGLLVKNIKELKYPSFKLTLGFIERFEKEEGLMIPVLDTDTHLFI